MNAQQPSQRLALIGQPNVGKSVLFYQLTGHYVATSNYPGTTVNVTRGASVKHPEWLVIDTPGVLSIPANTGDEAVTADILLREPLQALIQVGDAKNLRRALQLAFFLAEAEKPMVLALNMMDEAHARGFEIDTVKLSALLGMPVQATVATHGEGVAQLIATVQAAPPPTFRLAYAPEIEAALLALKPLLPSSTLGARAVGLLWLAQDAQLAAWLDDQSVETQPLEAIRARAQAAFQTPLRQVIVKARHQEADRIARLVMRQKVVGPRRLADRIGEWSVHPVLGWPMLISVLYAVFLFVGDFGAGTLVGLLEEDLFGEIINPWFQTWVQQTIGFTWLVDLLVGEFGLWTMGMTYALALIFPIVTTFFIAFGVLEDSGYFARLSVLSNRAFTSLGLNGRAILPMVLGLGCVTMATMSSRILHTPRERLIVTFLLALAIPCSAQLGVVLGMLSNFGVKAFIVWILTLILILYIVGRLANSLVKGKRIPLMTELPPMRWPLFGNVAKKTWLRLKWYLIEVIPIFLFGAFLMFVLKQVGVLPWIIEAAEPLVTGWLGLPKEAAAALVMGFIRRDFGATGLFTMETALTPIQGLVGMVTLTLFVPCVASVLMIAKEQGVRVAIGMVAMIVPTAFLIGGLIRIVLSTFAIL